MLFPVRLRILLGLLMPPLFLRAVINSAIEHGIHPLAVIAVLEAVGVMLVASCWKGHARAMAAVLYLPAMLFVLLITMGLMVAP
jgi:hypothetical protein